MTYRSGPFRDDAPRGERLVVIRGTDVKSVLDPSFEDYAQILDMTMNWRVPQDTLRWFYYGSPRPAYPELYTLAAAQLREGGAWFVIMR